MKSLLFNSFNKQYFPILIIILIHIIALRFIEPISIDSKEYLAISKSIYEKNEYSVLELRIKEFKNFSEESPTRMRQPLYPFFLASTYWLFGGNVYLVLTIQLIINILSYLFIVKIAQLIFNKDLYIGSLLFVALYFPLWLLSAIILTETLFTFLLIMTIYFLTYSIIRANNKYLFLSGLFLGLSFLTRPIGLSLIISFFIALVISFNFKNAIKKWCIVFTAFIIIISPWFIRNILVLNDYIPLSSDGAYNFYCASLGVREKVWVESEEFREIVADGYYLDRESSIKFFDLGVKNIFNDPLKYFKNGLLRFINTWTYFPGSRDYEQNITFYFFTTLIQFGILITAFLGLFISNGKRLKLILLLPAIGFSLVTLISYSTSRFLIPTVPFILLLSGQGVNYLFKKFILSRKQSKITK